MPTLKISTTSVGLDMTPTPSKGSEDINVWIVEDDPFFRSALERLLKKADGMRCQMSFESCEEALGVIDRDFAPEVVLMDIGLPGMSGIEGIKRIKAISPASHLVVLSVHEDNEKIFDAICAGASGYLLKPSTSGKIVEAVKASRSSGATINPQIAQKVLDMFSEMATPQGEYGLTDREKEILGHLANGLTKNEIAEQLFISRHTVNMHVRNIYTKLQVHSLGGAVGKALRERLIN